MEKIEEPGTVKGLGLDKFNNEDRLSFANRRVYFRLIIHKCIFYIQTSADDNIRINLLETEGSET